MKNILNNKIVAWLIGVLILANIATLTFFSVGHLINQRNNSPKEFLAKKLNFSSNQKNAYFKLAKEHNESAQTIREQIKLEKETLFQLLKSENINDSIRNEMAFRVSKSIQSLDILTFEHFRKVRTICNEEQKPKFDEIIQKMVTAVNQSQNRPQTPIK
jgi:periplasmic protein CpxP/Spy